MAKRLILIIGLVFTFSTTSAFAADAETEPKNVQDASFQTRCLNATKMGFPKCADSPAECGSGTFSTYETAATGTDGKEIKDKEGQTLKVKKPKYNTPFNCTFLQEGIGGRTGYDLYKIVTLADGQVIYKLWFGEVLVGTEQGPVQALLSYEQGKEIQGPFTILYNYLGLVYNFLSGIIVAVVILIVIVGGIRISAAGGNADADKGGKDMIIKALIGMALWFTASVILYTINPTFFAF